MNQKLTPYSFDVNTYVIIREHTDSYSGTGSEPILADRIFTDPLKNRSSDPSTVSHMLSSHVD